MTHWHVSRAAFGTAEDLGEARATFEVVLASKQGTFMGGLRGENF